MFSQIGAIRNTRVLFSKVRSLILSSFTFRILFTLSLVPYHLVIAYSNPVTIYNTDIRYWKIFLLNTLYDISNSRLYMTTSFITINCSGIV